MCKKKLLVFIMLCSVGALHAQKNKTNINQFVDVTGTIGNSQGTTAIAYVYNKRLGKNKNIEAGLGLRWTSYFGSETNFITAPARLARTTTLPFIIVFAGQKYENIDTLTVQHPLTNSVNININLGYNFSTRWNAGFNIDLIGFTSGRRTSAILTSNGTTKNESKAKPTAFNVLLTGDNDYGSLNSEYFVKYKIDKRWALKAVYQFLFVEYKTENVKQTAPDGTIVDRFRNKANNFGIGISYNF